jgi:site-specific recombinase XerD
LRTAMAPESQLAHVSTDVCVMAHENGVPGKVVAQLLGHTNAGVTINVYTQVMDHSLREAWRPSARN